MGQKKEAPNDQTQTHAAVLAAEAEWVKAHQVKNLEMLERLMDDAYLVVTGDGDLIDKAADLDSYRPADRFWTFAQSDQYDLRLYGDVAVLIGRWRGVGQNGAVSFDYQARFTAVYVKRKTGWKMLLAQSTDLA